MPSANQCVMGCRMYGVPSGSPSPVHSVFDLVSLHVRAVRVQSRAHLNCGPVSTSPFASSWPTTSPLPPDQREASTSAFARPRRNAQDEARDEPDGLAFSITASLKRSGSTAREGTKTPCCCPRSRPSYSRRPALRRSISPSPTSPEISDHARARRLSRRRDGVIATRLRA